MGMENGNKRRKQRCEILCSGGYWNQQRLRLWPRIPVAVSYTHLTLPTNREESVSWARDVYKRQGMENGNKRRKQRCEILCSGGYWNQQRLWSWPRIPV